jgi:tetratricopeptide (TPR) repeat protein
MLLNMDWHIDQMRRKAYESEVLPISLTPDKYINGTRDIVFVQERTQQTANLKDIIEFVSSDLPQAKVESTSGEKFNFIPTRSFRLPVDTAVVLKNGTVAYKDRDKIVPAIEWTYNRSSMGKSALIVLDILANNNWNRPVYFASLGHEGTLGLENYMQLEGFAYRLVPIQSQSISRYEAGRVESDILYKNLMTQFRWGGMNDPGVYLDDFHVRTTSVVRIRTRFNQLASELINQGDTAKAIKVLDRAIDLTPNEKIPFDHTIIQIANNYYRCNQFEKANKLVNQLGAICNEKLTYYLDQKPKFIAAINEEVLYNFQVLQNLISVSKNFNQTGISNQLDSLSNQQYTTFSARTTSP